MAEQVTNYQCPACGGGLKFSHATGKLECEYCDSSFTVAEVEAFYAEKDAKAKAAFAAEEKAKQEETGDASDDELNSGEWDASDIGESWGAAAGQMRSYICPSCGAELICEMTTAATQCPYCGNPTIIPGQFRDTLKPDYVIPFKRDKEAAVEAFKKYYRGKPFLPKTFSSEYQIRKLQGVYVPFWLFDADAVGSMQFDGTRSSSHREGDYIVTETRHFRVFRSGNVRFERVPADASQKMPDDLMDSIEPFYYQDLAPFSTAYLPGYLADRFDVPVKACAKRADERCVSSVESLLRGDVRGYETVRTVRRNVQLSRGKVHYALFPVWLLKTSWNGKDYLFAMNGQTGKLTGDLPVSKGRFWGFWAALAAILSILLYFPVQALMR